MNYISKRSGSIRPQPPLQTASRHYRTYRRRLRPVSHSAATSSTSGGLLGQCPTVRRLLAQTSLAQYYYDISPRRPELIHFTRGRHGWAPWYDDWRKVAARVVLPSAAAIAAYYHSLETVPYTNRTHLVVLPPRLERRLGELLFDDIKKEHAAKILPSDHRDSVRVRKVTSDILRAAERTLAPVKRGGELLDDRWLAKSHGYGDRQAKAMTRHLDGLDWEVIVVEDKQVNAMCVPGKIVVYTGLLDYFKTDAEIASVLGHEVGHIIARHAAEAVSKKLCSFLLRLVCRQFIDSPGLVRSFSTLLFKLPFSRRMETEADHIGMLLFAAAGFDPHMAIEVAQKLGKITGDSGLQNYLSTHPSSEKRVQFLLQDKVLKEAMELYRENGHGKEGERYGISDPFDTNTKLIV